MKRKDMLKKNHLLRPKRCSLCLKHSGEFWRFLGCFGVFMGVLSFWVSKKKRQPSSRKRRKKRNRGESGWGWQSRRRNDNRYVPLQFSSTFSSPVPFCCCRCHCYSMLLIVQIEFLNNDGVQLSRCGDLFAVRLWADLVGNLAPSSIQVGCRCRWHAACKDFPACSGMASWLPIEAFQEALRGTSSKGNIWLSVLAVNFLITNKFFGALSNAVPQRNWCLDRESDV